MINLLIQSLVILLPIIAFFFFRYGIKNSKGRSALRALFLGIIICLVGSYIIIQKGCTDWCGYGLIVFFWAPYLVQGIILIIVYLVSKLSHENISITEQQIDKETGESTKKGFRNFFITIFVICVLLALSVLWNLYLIR